MNGMSNMAAMNAKMAAGFGSYGRYPGLAGYGNGYGSSSSGGGGGSAYGYTDAVQTDTPPQTPPNLKLNTGNSLGQHQYHPYVSPQQQQQQHGRLNNPMPLPPTMAESAHEMASPGSMAAPPSSSTAGSSAAMMTAPSGSQPQQQQQQQHGSPNSADSSASNSTAFRPVYRT